MKIMLDSGSRVVSAQEHRKVCFSSNTFLTCCAN